MYLHNWHLLPIHHYTSTSFQQPQFFSKTKIDSQGICIINQHHRFQMVSNSFQQKKQSQHGLPLRWLGLFGHRCHLGHWKCMLPSLVRCWGQDFCSWAKCDSRSLGRIWHVLQGKDGIEMVGGLLEQTWKTHEKPTPNFVFFGCFWSFLS